jgi:hypothetical protein
LQSRLFFFRELAVAQIAFMARLDLLRSVVWHPTS